MSQSKLTRRQFAGVAAAGAVVAASNVAPAVAADQQPEPTTDGPAV
jgi:hypothetical protein